MHDDLQVAIFFVLAELPGFKIGPPDLSPTTLMTEQDDAAFTTLIAIIVMSSVKTAMSNGDCNGPILTSKSQRKPILYVTTIILIFDNVRIYFLFMPA